MVTRAERMAGFRKLAPHKKGYITVVDEAGGVFCYLRRPAPRVPGAKIKTRNRLNARSVASITKPGRHSDGQNLYLSISTDGARGWVYRCRLHGRPTEIAFGSARDVTLARARELAKQVRARLADAQLRDRIGAVLDAAAASAGQLLTGAG
jgi:hypothetical protein